MSFRRHSFAGTLWCSNIILLAVFTAMAEPPRQGPVFNFVEENDLIVDTDRHYTQGIKLSFLFGDASPTNWVSRFSDWLPALGLKREASKVGLAVGQNIYTPADIDTPVLQVNDRPYAGWLYVGMILQRRGTTFQQTPTLDSLELDLGVIGSQSLGEDAQTWVHQIRDFNLPQGWANQLTTEPTLSIKYQRAWRLRKAGECGWGVECIPHTGVSLGNVATSFHIGGLLRAGYHLPDDFGLQNIDSLSVTTGGYAQGDWKANLGFNVFGGIEGRAVAYSTLLDGNLFHQSHQVIREPLVGDFKAGFAVTFKRAELAYMLVLRTKEYTAQTERNAFGTLALKMKF